MTAYCFEPIGRIRSCFSQKFGIPRQPGLVPQARAVLEINAPYSRAEAFRGLEAFSHIWVIFVFHCCKRAQWKATVRPPRLGGNRRLGVFATRSGFRPNPIGQSVVELSGIESRSGGLALHLRGVDLLDGTPVLDIKPYLPYADVVAGASAGYAQQPPAPALSVSFSPTAEAACRSLEKAERAGLRELIGALLACDPRPGYGPAVKGRLFGMRLWDVEIRFRVEAGRACVEALEAFGF